MFNYIIGIIFSVCMVGCSMASVVHMNNCILTTESHKKRVRKVDYLLYLYGKESHRQDDAEIRELIMYAKGCMLRFFSLCREHSERHTGGEVDLRLLAEAERTVNKITRLIFGEDPRFIIPEQPGERE